MRADFFRLGFVLIFFVLAFVLALAFPRSALAHHTPGHGASEGVRNINSLGNRGGKVASRLLVLEEFGWAASTPLPGLRSETSLLGEYAPVPMFSFGAQAPLLIVDEAGRPPVVGYGDTRAFLRFTPHADKLVHRTMTFNLSASFPTRTVTFSVDPGRVWSVTPSMVFTRTYGDWYWQAIALAGLETRPAGVAIDVSAGGQAGGRLADGALALGGGVIVDIRTANFCTAPDRSIAYCNDSARVSVSASPDRSGRPRSRMARCWCIRASCCCSASRCHSPSNATWISVSR